MAATYGSFPPKLYKSRYIYPVVRFLLLLLQRNIKLYADDILSFVDEQFIQM